MSEHWVAELGQMVYWYPDGDRHQEPLPAVVTGIGSNSLNLNIFDRNSYNLRIRDGVRHVDDPAMKRDEQRESGGWQHTPATLRLRELEQKLLNTSKK